MVEWNRTEDFVFKVIRKIFPQKLLMFTGAKIDIG